MAVSLSQERTPYVKGPADINPLKAVFSHFVHAVFAGQNSNQVRRFDVRGQHGIVRAQHGHHPVSIRCIDVGVVSLFHAFKKHRAQRFALPLSARCGSQWNGEHFEKVVGACGWGAFAPREGQHVKVLEGVGPNQFGVFEGTFQRQRRQA